MNGIFQVNPQLDIPIYQQIVDAIRLAVKKGTLTPDQKLPTVQELASQLCIARGTIKRAYDELEHLGILEKIQGRGTFIRSQPENSGSRKERAMAAIDTLLDELDSMGFTSTEISIFLDLKQRERAMQLSPLKVAVVECNAENLSRISEQLRSMKGIELYSYLLDSVRQYPYKLDEELDLVITTAEHAAYIASILPDPDKLAQIALRLTTDTLSGIMQLPPAQPVEILCFSTRFGDLVSSSCRRYGQSLKTGKPVQFSAEEQVLRVLKGSSTVLVPRDYEKYCSKDVAHRLKTLEKSGRVLLCSYKLDEGSFLHLEEAFCRLRQTKK